MNSGMGLVIADRTVQSNQVSIRRCLFGW